MLVAHILDMPQRPSRVSSLWGNGRARAKTARKRLRDDWPVPSFRALLADPATLTRHRAEPTVQGSEAADMIISPKPYQAEVLRLLPFQA